jgi:hypothetical protein
VVVFGILCRYRTARAVPLQSVLPCGDGRYAMTHSKLDERVRLSSQFPQFVTVFVDERGRIGAGIRVVRGRGESREETAVDWRKFRVFYSQLSPIYCSIFLPAERSEKLGHKQRLQGP